MLSIPALCWLCQMPLAIAHHGCCSLCLRHLPRLPPCCPRCGLPALHEGTPCGRCLVHPPAWSRIVAVCDWQPPVKALVKRLKFYRITALSLMLARLMLLAWLAARRQHGLRRPDVMMTVPLQKNRAWQRGFNQMDDIARYLAHCCGCRYLPAALKRTRKAKIQHRLTASARRRNLRGAFRVEIDVRERHITLLDDVVTTGSTAQEISRILLAAGAASVEIWCLCRTL
ncbi:DNA utilization protein GntX [Erwinia sp. HDF1-3R]|uniref:DNA utilization protein GntX n=1 Tax=Erwinia sp. HDF1-3R TaxID=3141543 RepID=UPI0031F52EA4